MFNKYEDLFLVTTDTITGIGAVVSEKNRKAIFDLKQRPEDKKLVMMVGSIEQARKLKDWSKKAEKYAKNNWPGAVTLVLSPEQAVRMPDNEGLCNLILKLGPVYMTSANISSKKHLSFDQAKETFYEIRKYYDFGRGSGKPSSIIDVNTGEVIR